MNLFHIAKLEGYLRKVQAEALILKHFLILLKLHLLQYHPFRTTSQKETLINGCDGPKRGYLLDPAFVPTRYVTAEELSSTWPCIKFIIITPGFKIMAESTG